jgi:hypothetical protein
MPALKERFQVVKCLNFKCSVNYYVLRYQNLYKYHNSTKILDVWFAVHNHLSNVRMQQIFGL